MSTRLVRLIATMLATCALAAGVASIAAGQQAVSKPWYVWEKNWPAPTSRMMWLYVSQDPPDTSPNWIRSPEGGPFTARDEAFARRDQIAVREHSVLSS